jgi:hypothetical protein
MREEMEAQLPKPSHSCRMARRQSVAMEVDVPCFIAQNQFAHLREGLIADMATDQAVVAGADDLDDEQHEHFELHAKRASDRIEEAEAERICGEFAADPPTAQASSRECSRSSVNHRSTTVRISSAEARNASASAATSRHSPPPSPS